MRIPGCYRLVGMLVALTALGTGFTAMRRSPPTMEPSYRLRLTSAWPELQAPNGCTDGGAEMLEGTLIRTGDASYAGKFTRRTRLLFCGSHGKGAGACELTLEGEGEVTMSAVVIRDETSPSGRSARLTWQPTAGHRAVVSGPCAESFKLGVKQMYLSVRHGAEVPLPTSAAPLKQQLDNYGYVAEIE